eukprot:scaffold9232_cov129-Isochrysis_galbana.AAC.6
MPLAQVQGGGAGCVSGGGGTGKLGGGGSGDGRCSDVASGLGGGDSQDGFDCSCECAAIAVDALLEPSRAAKMLSTSNEVRVKVAPQIQAAPTAPLPFLAPSTLGKVASPSSQSVSASVEAARAYGFESGGLKPRFGPGLFGAIDEALPFKYECGRSDCLHVNNRFFYSFTNHTALHTTQQTHAQTTHSRHTHTAHGKCTYNSSCAPAPRFYCEM